MNADLLVKHFDRLCDAPDAVPRLRQFVLELAVRGKLVEQDPKDEPASKLVNWLKHNRIQTESRKRPSLAPAAPQELDFICPQGWEIVRLGNILEVIRGASPRPKGDPRFFSSKRTRYHWVKISDIRKHGQGKFVHDTDEFLTEAGSLKSVCLPKGTFVVTNSATIGVPAVLEMENACIHDGFLAFPGIRADYFSIDFLFILIQALKSYAVKKARGMAQLNLNIGLVRSFPLAVPPLNEQHRIVAKVDELMALCDELEAAQTQREEWRDRLNKASLKRLSEPEWSDDGASDFKDHASFHLRHLDRLTIRPEHVTELRQSILNLAVRGRLVPQDPSEEPASELLKRISEERLKLIRSGRLKNKAGSKIKLDARHVSFDIPASWDWVPFQDVLVFGPQNGISPRKTDQISAPRAITLTATTKGFFDPSYFKRVSAEVPKGSDYWLRDGDLLFQRANTRDYVGMAAIYDRGENEFLYPDLIMKTRVSDSLSLRFVHICAISPTSRSYFSSQATGAQSSMPKINQTHLVSWPLPIPPLNEQKRIVAKVDELMAMCDEIEDRLSESQETSRRLLESVLSEALSSAA